MTHSTEVEMQSLSQSLKPLIDHFNAHQEKLRFLAVFSPMCPK
jgi:hypothetical protein